jgi:crotonobetainyl-CoA:carnitine CoA-transferase CaiB-like acyl-CoA transferase
VQVGPLQGTVVLDFGMNIAGPYAASILSDFGADVVKVEPPSGDSARAYPPMVEGMSVLFASMNHDKRYLALDLRHPRADDVVARLVERADVLIENLRPGKASELGIDATTCHRRNPRLVYCSVDAFYPQDGDRPGYDLMVQAESGFLSLTGEEHGGPSRTPASVLDHVAAMWVAMGAMGALAGQRGREVVHVSMLDVAMALFNDRASSYVATGEVPTRMGSALPTTTPHRAYPTRDGEVVVGAANDALFKKLAALLGAPVDDERFTTLPGRLSRRAELDALLEDAFGRETTATWLARLDARGVPAAAVRDLAEAVDRHRGLSATGFFDVPDVPGLSLVAPPVRLRGARWAPRAPGRIGNDTVEILRELAGLEDHEIERAIDEGIVRA